MGNIVDGIQRPLRVGYGLLVGHPSLTNISSVYSRTL